MKENGNKNKAELCSKRGIDENVAGNRRAVRRSNSWVGSNVEVIKQSAKRVFELDDLQPPVTLICQKHRPNQKTCQRQYYNDHIRVLTRGFQ